MIVVTGAAGFIGSCMITKLNEEGYNYIVAVDSFGDPVKEKNLDEKRIKSRVDRGNFIAWLEKNHEEVEFVFHLGARTDTGETRKDIFDTLNLSYSKEVWTRCALYQIPLLYASSAATYGAGENGYDDDEDQLRLLRPLNEYAKSKHEFDKWTLSQDETPFFWVGLKFFNVFGPNEYHKGPMASVIYHAYNQITNTGVLKLFKSHHKSYADGMQMRDFIYVNDVVNVMYWWMLHRKNSGIYNLGTGIPNSFLQLSASIFEALGKEKNIEFIDTPEVYRKNYQYYTKADMTKLRQVGYDRKFTPFEDSIISYVNRYLTKSKHY